MLHLLWACLLVVHDSFFVFDDVQLVLGGSGLHLHANLNISRGGGIRSMDEVCK